ncbi:MAG: hypothetical protein IK100_01385 [Muribaculaceae bacterium]|nr:hypothetical protein [Muribaculaceae bacterium]
MKRFFAIMGVLALAGLMICAAPKKRVQGKKHVKTTVSKKVGKNKKQSDPKEMLVKFRLEYQQEAGRGCKSSAVMSLSQNEYGDYLYHRGFGEYEGWSYDFDPGVCSELMLELSRIAEKKALSRNKFTNLDDEDITKPRWLVTMKTKDGKEYSMVEYSDGSELHKLVEAAFQPVLEKVGTGNLRAPFSHYNYNADGTLNYRIDHTSDGTVHGGYDPKRPDVCY